MTRRTLIALLALSLLSGCATTGTGSKWYAPATWFSGAPAAAVDKADARAALLRESIIKAAQKQAHETSYALLAAPASRPVDVATVSNDTAVSLLDQVAGPLSISDASMARDRVAALLSENASIRAEAEAQRAKDQAGIATISDKLAKAVADSQAANDKLRVAYDRENELANQLRSQKALLWIAGSLSVLCALGWLYAKIAFGGIPGALGGVLNSLQAKHPALADELRTHLDQHLNRNEQAVIRAAVIRQSP